jgi:ATP phosphoribosyltransferase regulatory subunit
MKSALWLLPDGVEELLPADAEHIEDLRRQLLALYHCWGYRMVVPPLVEFLDSLLTGVGQDLELQTFKLTDQVSGRMMGVRADMTPQVARIDARFHHPDQANRLCYIGSVLRTRAKSQLSSRSPLQSGCELFGVSGIEADIEMISLMLEALGLTNITSLHLDLSHVAIGRRLLDLSGLDEDGCARLTDAWRRKAIPEVDQIAADVADPLVAEHVRALPRSMVSLREVDGLLQRFSDDKIMLASLQALQSVAGVIAARFPAVDICFDLCEMRGYHYHTGLFFAAYAPGFGQAIAEGGRYDGVGLQFGQNRAATGFSVDLRALLKSRAGIPAEPVKSILVPLGTDDSAWPVIRQLRQSDSVIFEMPGDKITALRERCNRRLLRDELGQWQIESWL